MTSLYNLSVPVLREVLETTTHVLNKGEAFAKEHEISDADLLHERLYPDMFNLRLQILVILIVSRTTVTTLTGKDVPGIPKRDQSLNKLHSLIDETIEILAAVLPQEVDGKENQATSVSFFNEELRTTVKDYVVKYSIPTVYFHLTTVYGLLRRIGVPVGKKDYVSVFMRDFQLAKAS